jgi:hypothetical protein
MKIKAISIDKRFIPEWNENKKLPPAEQVVINFLRIPGTSEKGNYIDFGANAKGDFRMIYNDTSLIAAFVESIENLELKREDGQTDKIRKGSELAAANASILSELFTEIRSYLFPTDEELDTGE